VVSTAETTTRKQRGRPFSKGRSGNPAGRPVGARGRAAAFTEALMDSEATEIVRKAIAKAKAGDSVCLRICIDRILPPRRDRTVQFDLPQLESAADAVRAMSSVLVAVASGELTPSEGETISGIVATWMQSLQISDFEQRLARLEKENPT